MDNEAARFNKRKLLRKKYAENKHVKELANSDLSKALLSEATDTSYVEWAFLKTNAANSFDVSEAEVRKSLELLDKQYTNEKYDALFESSKEVLIDQLLGPLKLSRSDLQSYDRDFEYKRDDYMKSTNNSDEGSVSFKKQCQSLRQERTNSDGKIQDEYTGEFHDAKEVDLDHIKSTKEFHDGGGYMLSDSEKRQFAAAPENLAFTHKSVNRSKGSKNLGKYSDLNSQLDKRRTKAAQARAEKTAEKFVPSGTVEKTLFVTGRSMKDGFKSGTNQGLQQALAVFLSEFISATFHEVKDVFNNGIKGKGYDLSWLEALGARMRNVMDRLLVKWKDVASAFATGALSGFLSAVISALLNMFVRTGKNIVRLIREGFLSLSNALKLLIFPPEGTSFKQAAHEASKILATGLVVSGGIVAGEYLENMLGGIPFADTISLVLTGLISGLGSLLVVFMLDKLDLFGINENERHEFIMRKIESRINFNIERCEAVIERWELSYSD